MDSESPETKQKVAFSAAEKKVLVSLLKHEKIIHNKNTNKATNSLKAQAWARITQRYNMNPLVTTKRETMQLRRCWEKIKRFAKYGRSKEMRDRLATGGSSPPPPDDPDIDPVSRVDVVVTHVPCTVDTEAFVKTERQDITDSGASSPLNNPDISNMEADTNEEFSPTVTSNISVMQRDYKRPRMPFMQSSFQNRHSSARRRFAPTVSDMTSMRQVNILKEREQQQDLYLLQRSILTIERDIASENLRHQQEINRIKEIVETEKLEHHRALWRNELEFALNNKNT